MSLSNITKAIYSGLDNLPGPSELVEEERVALLSACDQLKMKLESPIETTSRIIFGTHQLAAVRIGIDIGLFDIFAAASGANLDSDEISKQAKIPQYLLVRWLRILAGMGILSEVGRYKYKALPQANLFVTGSPLADAVVHFGVQSQTLVKLPEYLSKTGYKNPDNAFDGPFQYAQNTKDHYFTWLAQNPRYQKAFNSVMTISRLNRGEEWFDFYPVVEKLVRSGSDEATDVLLVDIGGGRGHDLQAFKSRHPSLSGRLVLEDLPQVIDDINNPPEGIELVKHDMFTPQPIKNAKAYYLRTVLHDWPDMQAREVLEHIKAAMGTDSVLLVNENTIPEDNIPLYPAQLDISMMVAFASLERTQSQWITLFESVGFKIQAVWEPKNKVTGSGTLFEVTLS